jgi:hypothetical protein
MKSFFTVSLHLNWLRAVRILISWFRVVDPSLLDRVCRGSPWPLLRCCANRVEDLPRECLTSVLYLVHCALSFFHPHFQSSFRGRREDVSRVGTRSNEALLHCLDWGRQEDVSRVGTRSNEALLHCLDWGRREDVSRVGTRSNEALLHCLDLSDYNLVGKWEHAKFLNINS